MHNTIEGLVEGHPDGHDAGLTRRVHHWREFAVLLCILQQVKLIIRDVYIHT